MNIKLLRTGLDLNNMSNQEIRNMIIPLARGDQAKEDEYRNFANNLEVLCKQCYQLVAWMWLDEPMLEDEEDQQKEKELKKQFKQALDEQAKRDDDSGSNKLKDFFTGVQPSTGLNIPEFYNKAVGANVYPITSDIIGSEKIKLRLRVEKEDPQERKLVFDSSKEEFIVTLHFPPSRSTVSGFEDLTNDNIKAWVRDVSGAYLPNSSTGFPQNIYLGGF